MADESFVSGNLIGAAPTPKISQKSTPKAPAQKSLSIVGQREAHGEREYISVPFAEVPVGECFSREYKTNYYMVYTKRTETDFPGDFVVWVFRKVS